MKGQDAVSLVMNCDARSREESLVSAYCRSAEAIGASTQLQKSRHSNYELQAYTYFENETRSLVLYASVRRDSSKLNFVFEANDEERRRLRASTRGGRGRLTQYDQLGITTIVSLSLQLLLPTRISFCI